MPKYGDLTEDTAPDGADLIAIKDSSAGTSDRVTLTNLAASSAWSTAYASARSIAASGSDDTAALQALLDLGGTTVFRSGQTYLVNPDVALFPVSDSTIIIEKGATVQASAGASTSRIFNMTNVDRVVMQVDGNIKGDLLTHVGTTGQHGHGINIANGSTDITVSGSGTISLCWGDGIYLGETAQVQNIRIEGVTVDDCRREGIGIMWAADVLLSNVTVKNTGVTALSLGVPQSPGSGIDIEPNVGEAADRVTIVDCVISNTEGSGMYVVPNTGSVADFVIDGITIRDCGGGDATLGTYRFNGIQMGAATKPLLSNVNVSGAADGVGQGGNIYFRSTVGPTVNGGLIEDSAEFGIFVAGGTMPIIRGVRFRNNSNRALGMYQVTGGRVTDCDFDTNPVPVNRTHAYIDDCDDITFDRNRFVGTAGTYWLTLTATSSGCAVMDNLGVGTTPSTGALSDLAASTTKVGNLTATGGAGTAW